MEDKLSAQEIASHRSTSSCWIVVDSEAYDVTSYLNKHPGGAAVLLKQGGTVRKSWSLYIVLTRPLAGWALSTNEQALRVA